jgi:hypothetical protein
MYAVEVPSCPVLSDLQRFRTYAENTRVRYSEFLKQSEEQRLSFQIFNSHVRQFHEAFVKFLKHARLEKSLSRELEHEKGLNPLEWYQLHFGKPIVSAEDACRYFLLYNPKGSFFSQRESPEHEEIYSACVSELTNLISRIEDFAEHVEEGLTHF